MSVPSRDDWSRAVESDFAIDAIDPATGDVIAQVIRLTEVTEAVESGGFVSWSLLFTGSAGEMFEQGTATIRHSNLGEQVVFLVPLGVGDTEASYESVFSVAAAE